MDVKLHTIWMSAVDWRHGWAISWDHFSLWDRLPVVVVLRRSLSTAKNL